MLIIVSSQNLKLLAAIRNMGRSWTLIEMRRWCNNIILRKNNREKFTPISQVIVSLW